MSDQITAWMRDYYGAWDAADPDAVMAWYSDDVVLEDVPSGHIATGTEQARAFVENAIEHTPGTTYEVVSGVTNGDRYATEWIMQPAGLRGSSVGTIHKGKITANRDYWNAAPPTK